MTVATETETRTSEQRIKMSYEQFLAPDWLWQQPLPAPLLMLATIAPQALRAALDDQP